MQRLAAALVVACALLAATSAQLLRDFTADNAANGFIYEVKGAAYLSSRDAVVIIESSYGSNGESQSTLRAYSVADGGVLWSSDSSPFAQNFGNVLAPAVSDAGVVAFFADTGERVLLSADGDVIDSSYVVPEGESVFGSRLRWLREGVLAFMTSRLKAEGGKGPDQYFPWRVYPGGEVLSDPTGQFTGDFGSVANGDGPNLREFSTLVAAPTESAPDRVITATSTVDRDFGNRKGTMLVAIDATTGATLAVLKPNCAERSCGVTMSVVVDPSGGDVYVVERSYLENWFVIHRVSGDLSSYMWSRQITAQFVDWTFDFVGEQPFNNGFQSVKASIIGGELVVAAALRFEDWGPVSPVAVPEVDVFNGGAGYRLKMLTSSVNTQVSEFSSETTAQDIVVMKVNLSDGSFTTRPRVVGTQGLDSLNNDDPDTGSVLDIGDGDLVLIGRFNADSYSGGGGALGLVVLGDGECN